MATYSLRIPECYITSIRSHNSDTLYASTAVRVMNQFGGLHRDFPGTSIPLGDRHPGETVPINLSIEGVDLPDPTDATPDGGAIYWSFLLVNTGQTDWSVLTTALNNAANGVSGALISSKDPTNLLIAGAIIGAQALMQLLTAGCDGIVAAQNWALTGADLVRLTANPSKAYETTEHYPGSDSPALCGGNSDYHVAYNIVASGAPQVAVPNVLHRDPGEASALLRHAGLAVADGKVIRTNVEQPTVIGEHPAPGTVVLLGATVTIDIGVPKSGPQP